ncbi:MAG: phosphoribosylanthranilate isomerase [Pseudomonadota bacterium]
MSADSTPNAHPTIRVKICGLTRVEDVRHAAAAGASYLGYVFFPPSPRAIGVDAAQRLMEAAPDGVIKTALTVDPDDALVEALRDLPTDLLQLHGRETPERVAEIRRCTGLPVMKAIGIRDASDLTEIARYEAVADKLLIDAKPPKGATRPGGNAISFDWRLIAGRRWQRPWLLAGGLTPENVAEAIRLTGADAVDVSSSVESAPGVKDPSRTAAFITAAQSRQAA